MLKAKSVLLSVVVFMVVIAGGVCIVKTYQPADAQINVNSQREEELAKWQNEVNQWNKSASLKAQQTNLSSQGIMQLPNTGPSEE